MNGGSAVDNSTQIYLQKIQGEMHVFGDSESKRQSVAIEALPVLEQLLTRGNHPQAAVILLNITELFGKKLQQPLNDVISKLSSLITEYIHPSDPNTYVYLNLLEFPVTTNHPDQSQLALKKLREVLAKHAARINDFQNPATIIEFLLEYAGPAEKRIAQSKMYDLLQKTHTLVRTDAEDLIDGVSVGIHPLPYLINTAKRQAFLEIYQIFHQHLAQYGLDGYDCMARWRNGCIPELFGVYATMNLAAIQDIEKVYAHGAKKLLDKNGIINFARYPIELLLSQISSIKDTSSINKPYVVIATSEFDDESNFGAAFNSKSFYQTLLYIFQTFQDKNPIWVTELPENKLQIAHRVNHPNKPVLFYFLAIHGSPTALYCGNDERGNKAFLTADDFTPDNQFFGIGNVVPTGYTFLASCATGMISEGTVPIAQTLAQKTNSRIIAPQAAGGIKALEINAHPGSIDSISVSFVGGRRHSQTPISVHLFSGDSISTVPQHG